MPKYRFTDLLDSVAALQNKRTLADPSYADPGLPPSSTPDISVDVNEPGYLSQIPDLYDRNIRNTYQAPDISPVSTSAQGEYLNQLRDRPIPRDPGFLNKLISGAAGASEGWFQGPGRGLATAEAYRETPYRRALQTWEGESFPAHTAVGYETEQNRQNLLRSKILAEIAKDQAASNIAAQEAITKGEQSETSRFKTQADIAEANTKTYGMLNPERKVLTAAVGPTNKMRNEIVTVDPRRGRVYGTGVEGYPKWRPIEELDEMIDRRNAGLKDLFKSIPEKDSHAALENAYRKVSQDHPDRFGQFMDKTTGYVKSAAEIQKIIRDPAMKIAWDDLVQAAGIEAQNTLSKFKVGKEGSTVRPSMHIGEFEFFPDKEE